MWEALLAFDVLVLVLTVWKTSSIWYQGNGALHALLLHDGMPVYILRGNGTELIYVCIQGLCTLR